MAASQGTVCSNAYMTTIAMAFLFLTGQGDDKSLAWVLLVANLLLSLVIVAGFVWPLA